MSPIEAMLLTIMVIFLIYRGIINIPFILKKKKKPGTILGLHSDCKNFSSFISILDKAMRDTSEIMHIKYIETVYDQMNLVEESWRRIRVDLKQAFVKNLSDNISEHHKQDAKVCYNLVIDKIGRDMIGLMRKWIKRNHFTEKTEIEFQTYIGERVKDLEEFFTIAIQDVYVPDQMLVDLKQLRKFSVEKVMPEISREIFSLFTKIRIVAIEKEAEIQKIKEKLPNDRLESV